MIASTIRLFVMVYALLCWTAVPAVSSGHEEHTHHATAEHAEQGGNPLIEEMVKLESVFHEVVSGVALGDGQRVHRAIESMHGAMEKTHEGVHHGTVKTPKNADRVKEFVALDKQFHHRLEKLGQVAEKNDQTAMLRLTKELLSSCVECHREFRNP